MFYFIKQFLFLALVGPKIKIEPAALAPGLMGPKNFLQAKNFLSSLTLAQLSMQASKVVAAKAARFLKGNAT